MYKFENLKNGKIIYWNYERFKNNMIRVVLPLIPLVLFLIGSKLEYLELIGQ